MDIYARKMLTLNMWSFPTSCFLFLRLLMVKLQEIASFWKRKLRLLF